MSDIPAPVAPEFRALTAEESALVARFPLPDPVTDCLVNKTQLAEALDVSVPSVTDWLRKGLPVEDAGTNGKAYSFRLSVAWAWRQKQLASEAAARRAADDSINQLALHLTGGTVNLEPGVSVAEQRGLMQTAMLRDQAARQRRELVPRAEVVELFEALGVSIRSALDALPDRLGRDLGLEGRDLERVETACDDIMGAVSAAVEKVLRDDATPPD